MKLGLLEVVHHHSLSPYTSLCKPRIPQRTGRIFLQCRDGHGDKQNRRGDHSVNQDSMLSVPFLVASEDAVRALLSSFL